MAGKKLFLYDLDKDYYIVKKFVIKGDVIYQKSEQEPYDGVVNIRVDIDDGNSFLILNDHGIEGIGALTIEAALKGDITHNDHLFIYVDNSGGIDLDTYVSFRYPYAQFRRIRFFKDKYISKEFNDLMRGG